MNFLENVSIKDYCTLKAGGQFRFFTVANSMSDLENAYNFAKEKSLDVFVIGGGSNLVFPDGVFDVLALKINILGFEIVYDEKDFVEIKVGAGRAGIIS